MHPNSLKLMDGFFRGHVDGREPGFILDVGSGDVNGTYRHLTPDRWCYVGLDIEPGNNVDLVEPVLPWSLGNGSFDVVISGQCLEHAERPWEIAAEIGRVLKPGGACCIIAPWRWEVHRHPMDCWRILPDGMSVLLGLAGCDVLEAKIDEDDCIGIGIRKGKP